MVVVQSRDCRVERFLPAATCPFSAFDVDNDGKQVSSDILAGVNRCRGLCITVSSLTLGNNN